MFTHESAFLTRLRSGSLAGPWDEQAEFLVKCAGELVIGTGCHMKEFISLVAHVLQTPAVHKTCFRWSTFHLLFYPILVLSESQFLIMHDLKSCGQRGSVGCLNYTVRSRGGLFYFIFLSLRQGFRMSCRLTLNSLL